MYCGQKALKLKADYADATALIGSVMYAQGQYRKAIVIFKSITGSGEKYDPFNPLHTAWLGALYCYNGQYEDAIRESLKSLEIQKDYPASYFVLGHTYLAMGRIDEAIETHKKLAENSPWWKSALGYTYAISGHREEAEKILNELEESKVNPWNAYGLTVMYTALGKKDEAFKWLAYEPHHAFVAWIAVMPEFKSLHDDVRFKVFVKQLNIPK